MPHTPANNPIARTHVALDPGRVVRPGATPDRDQPDIVREWLAHLDAGRLVPAPRPPAEPRERGKADDETDPSSRAARPRKIAAA